MTEKIQCDFHGDADKTYVCEHLLGDSAGLGFNRGDPTAGEPYPDAWCDNCEIIRAAHGGWNAESEKLTKISLLCSGCYTQVRIRNTRTDITLDDLASLRWKCGSCDEWHHGPCLDFTYDSPHYWSDEYENSRLKQPSISESGNDSGKYFLDEELCQIGSDYFVRGLIRLPIVGTDQHLVWGVWGSVSRENFRLLLENERSSKPGKLPEMFSWLSTQIPEYPDTLRVKMYAHFGKPGERPTFEIEPTEHLLSKEYHEGILPDRVKQIVLSRLAGAQ